MDVIEPKIPEGQQFLLREYLQSILTAAPFEGDAWAACTSAFLAYRAMPLVGSNFTTLAPASFFLRLYTSREPEFGTEREGYWGEAECRQRLSSLGEQELQQLVATDKTRSWVIYLTPDLTAVVAFDGRLKPGPQFDLKQDARDLAEGEVVRSLIDRAAKIVRLDLTGFGSPKVELEDEAGKRYELTFSRCLRITSPPPGNEVVETIEEIRGPSGRSWFVFRGSNLTERQMAIQAESVEVRTL